MILLDTNVISEPWKPVPDEAVVAWLDAQAIETLFLSAISIAELRFGIAAIPVGRRQTILRDRLEDEVLPHFSERILPFNLATSQFYCELMAHARLLGRQSVKLMGT
jgi:predicted nucleic acid-binding protein